jgi:paraquat-inducible protein B
VTSRTIDDIQQQVSDIIDQIQKIPFQQIGQELDETLKEIAALSRNMNEALAPQLSQALIKMQTSLDEFNRLLSSSNEIPAMVGQSVQELEEVLRSTRQFVDELREKPNALLFGEPVRSYSRETLGAENP